MHLLKKNPVVNSEYGISSGIEQNWKFCTGLNSTDLLKEASLTLRVILTLSPDSINMCMFVFLLTTAFGPPRTGVGGSRRQLWGGRRGSCAGAAGFLSNHME